MGANSGKPKKITVPTDYKLIKLCSINAGLRNSVNAENKIKDILNYFKDGSFDIICVQGLYDYTSAYNMIKAVKTQTEGCDYKLYFTPDIEILDVKQDYNFLNINNTNTNTNTNKIKQTRSNKERVSMLKKSVIKIPNPTGSLNTQTVQHLSMKQNRSNKSKKDNFKNIIISKYPILSSSFTKLDEETDIDDIVGVQTVVCANIKVDNRIISVYNTELCKDIKIANIVNDNVRELELQEVFKVVESNRSNYVDLHFLIGTLNIKEWLDQELNVEYVNLVEGYNCCDIYRYKNADTKGSTSQLNERIDYIFLIKNIRDKLDSVIHKLYKIYFLDVSVKQTSSKMSFPLETTFMIKIEKDT